MPFQNAQGVMRISEVRGDAAGTQQGVIVNPVWHRYVTDQQSTTRALIDQNSALTDQISFLPFGEVQRRTGTTATPFQYTGEQQAAAGMTYLRARFMDPRQGRFLGMDPYAGNLRNPLSLNKFNYVHSNPVMGVDPTGNFTIMSVSFGGATQGITRSVGSRSAVTLAKAKLWKVDLYLRTSPWHTYIFLGSLQRPGTGYRYDVGVTDPKPGFLQALNTYEGVLRVSAVPPRRLAGRRLATVAKLTLIQTLIWQSTVMGLTAEDAIELKYGYFFGTNCTVWSIKAAILAIAIDRLKIGG
jgi:RHS repeat-associated protein